jgi:hypothetical protein
MNSIEHNHGVLNQPLSQTWESLLQTNRCICIQTTTNRRQVECMSAEDSLPCLTSDVQRVTNHLLLGTESEVRRITRRPAVGIWIFVLRDLVPPHYLSIFYWEVYFPLNFSKISFTAGVSHSLRWRETYPPLQFSHTLFVGSTGSRLDQWPLRYSIVLTDKGH